METISISKVLAEIHAPHAEPFVLTFVKSSRSDRGKIRTIAKCIKGTMPRKHEKSGDASSSGRTLHKEHDTLPLIDLEGDRYITIPISHIIGYNQYQVQH